MLTGNPFRVDQHQGSGLHRDGLVNAENSLLGIAHIHRQVNDARIGGVDGRGNAPWIDGQRGGQALG
jgi:hypothetical protein